MMTDQELVAAVAEKVLGWPSRGGCYHRVPGTATEFRADVLWTPLESWDDCFMVIDAMRTHGFRYDAHDTDKLNNAFVVVFDGHGRIPAGYSEGTLDDPVSQRRAVLTAALQAVEGAH